MQRVEATDFEGNTIEVDVAKLRWRPSAYGVVINEGKILLLKQTNGYDLPGGGVEMGESPETAVVREVKEETGLDVSSPKLLGVETSFYKPFNTENLFVQSLMIYYECSLEGGVMSNEGYDEAEKLYALGAEWVAVKDLDSIKLGTSVDFRKYIKEIEE